MNKTSFFHTPEFNNSLIVMFFTAFVAVTCAILPVMGLHRLGVAANDELSRYADPPVHRINPAVRTPSSHPVHGTPVAMTRKGESP